MKHILTFLIFVFLIGCSTSYTNTYSHNKPHFTIVRKADGTCVLYKRYVFVPYERQAEVKIALDRERQAIEKVSKSTVVAKPLLTPSDTLLFNAGLDITPTPIVPVPGL